MKANLIVCIDCKKAEKLTDFDMCPEYIVNSETLEYEEVEKNDKDEFLNYHEGHRIVYMAELKGEIISKGYFADPSCESFFKASDGSHTYIIRAWRETIADKMKYELIEDNILVRLEHIGFDSKEFLDSLDKLLKKEQLERNLNAKILDIINKNMGTIGDNLQQIDDYELTKDRQIATVTREWKEKVLSEINNAVKSFPDQRINEIISRKLDDIKYEVVKHIDVESNIEY